MADASTLNTERLLGRAIAPSDFQRLRAIHSDPRATATLSADRLPFSPAHTRRSLREWVRHWDENGFGVWMFHLRDGEFVGYAGLRRPASQVAADTELMYAIRPEFWRAGYATEMSEAVLRFGFEKAGLTEVIAMALPSNTGSRRVMEKCGFRYVRDTIHAGLPHVLYRLSRDEYLRAHEA